MRIGYGKWVSGPWELGLYLFLFFGLLFVEEIEIFANTGGLGVSYQLVALPLLFCLFAKLLLIIAPMLMEPE